MNPTQANELLERAAATVTPAENDPVSRMVSLGKRSVRRRRGWGAAVAVAAAVVVAAVALPLALAAPKGSDSAANTVSFGGLTVDVPKGWHTREVADVDYCTAQPRTIYLADRWSSSAPMTDKPGSPPYRCKSEGQPWMALVERGVPQYVNPDKLAIEDGRLLQIEQETRPSGWQYRAFNEEMMATGVFISGDEQLLKRVTWPAGPPAPPSGGLALPAHITGATSEDSGPMVSATDAPTLKRIRTELAKLRDPVPAGEGCTLQTPGAVGIAFDEMIVVLGDTTCPEAISSGGGRVRAPAGLGKELLALIVASDHAAVQAKKK